MSMTDDYETAVAMLRKAFADGNKLAPLALLYVTALTHRSDDGPEAEAIVKLTPAIPDTPPVATIEKATADLPIPAPLISANTSSLTPAIAQGRVSDAGTPAVIGLSAETSAAVSIGEEERCGGLYVLGQSQTGKSTLLVSLALSDISKGHGILFIDPHTDAIKDLLARIPDHRRNDILLLDPTNKTHSFGLNILHCKDPRNPLAIDETWGRVRDIFVKVWETEKGQRGFWLDKILRNSVYLLLGNLGYTMVEMPLLLREDTTFRNHLLESMKVKPSVRNFWYDEFDRLTRRDRTEQVGPALNRLSVFRDIDIVRHIVGQEVPPIDFQKIIQERKIVLLRLPVNMPSDVKHLIGTMLLSEVLYAAFEREKLAKTDRPYFGIYCDEFQEFATPDFARLFTQTGKYKVMPVVAHQTRLGQFKPGDPNQGATLASPNKVLFTLSASDAKEMAVEFAEKPPTELKDEDVYIISQHPVYDLLHGHDNPEIRALVDKYLRPLMDRLGDLLGEREIERLIRTDYLDEASLYRIEERIEAIRHEDPLVLRSSLGAAGGKLLQARYQTGKQIELMNEGIRIRSTMRMLNRIFIDMMEGKLDRGQEEFSNRLIEIAKAAILPDQDRRILELYIAYAYGEPGRDRILPFELAKRQGLFKEHVEQTERQINTEYETQRLAFRRRIGEINIEEILQENVRMFSTDRISYGRPEWTAKAYPAASGEINIL